MKKLKTKKVALYEIRIYGINGSPYSRMLFSGRLIQRKRASKIVKFLKKRGKDVVCVKHIINVDC